LCGAGPRPPNSVWAGSSSTKRKIRIVGKGPESKAYTLQMSVAKTVPPVLQTNQWTRLSAPTPARSHEVRRISRLATTPAHARMSAVAEITLAAYQMREPALDVRRLQRTLVHLNAQKVKYLNQNQGQRQRRGRRSTHPQIQTGFISRMPFAIARFSRAERMPGSGQCPDTELPRFAAVRGAL